MLTREEKISLANKGRKRTEQQRRNISRGMILYYKNETPERREKRIENLRNVARIKTQLWKNFNDLLNN